MLVLDNYIINNDIISKFPHLLSREIMTHKVEVGPLHEKCQVGNWHKISLSSLWLRSWPLYLRHFIIHHKFHVCSVLGCAQEPSYKDKLITAWPVETQSTEKV